MTRHKAISSLSIAAIALLAASAPSFAQTQSDQSGKDTSGSVATPAIEQTIASNRELTAVTRSRAGTTEVEPTSVNNAARTASSFILPANAFKVPNHFTSAEASRFINQQMNFINAGPSDPTARKQFHAGDDSANSSRAKGVTFVPSRGQKLPE